MSDVATGLGKPTEQIANIDQQIQITRLQLEAVQGFDTLRESLPQMVNTLGRMKEGLKGEPMSASDVFDVHRVGDEFPYLTVKDAVKVDKAPLLVDGVATAVDAQETLTTLAGSLTTNFKAFADHQSSLLSGMKKLQEGLDTASDLFKKTEAGIKLLEQGSKTFQHLLDGGISDEKLMEAFTDYLTTLADVLKPLTDLIPGLSDVIQTYVDAVKSVGPNVEKLRVAAVREESFLDIWTQAVEGTPVAVASDATPAPQTHASQIETRLEELKQQRITLVDAWNQAIAGMTDKEVAQLLAEANKRLAAEGVKLRTPAEIQAERDALTTLRLNRRAALDSEHPATAAALDDQIQTAEDAQEIALAADNEARKQLEAHMAAVMHERSHLYGPSDLAYLRDHFGGDVEVAANELERALPVGSAAGAVLLHQETEPKSTAFERFASWLFSNPAMTALGLLGMIAVVVIGFLLFGGGDDDPALIAQGEVIATSTSEAAETAETSPIPTATATEQPMMQLAPQHFSVCTNGRVLSGPMKVDPATGEPLLDANGNRINADNDQPFTCE